MTTMPPARPLTPPPPPSAARPAGPAGPGGGPNIDPVKLLQKYKWLLLGAAIAGAALGVVSHFALLKLYPVYTANAVYQCLPQQTDPGKPGAPVGGEKQFEKFMASQVNILQSDRIVDRTVADPELIREAPQFTSRFMVNGNLDTQEAARSLKRRLSAGVLGDTEFVRVAFWDNDRDTAVAVLRVLNKTYLADRAKDFESTSRNQLSNLRQTIAQRTTEIDQLRGQRQRLLQDSNVDSLEVSNNEARGRQTAINETIVKIAAEVEGARSQLEEMQAQLASPAGITYNDMIRQRVEENWAMIQEKQRLNGLEGQLAGMRERLGPNHKSVLDMQTLVNGTRQSLERLRERMLREEFNSRLDSLRTSVQAGEAQKADLLKRLEEATIRAQELTRILTQVKDVEDRIRLGQESIAQFNRDLQSFDVLTGQGRESRIAMYQDPAAPRDVTFPRLVIMIPAGIVLVLGLTSGLALLRELLDQRVKGPADVAMIPRTRVAGLIPHAAEDPGTPQKIETVFRDFPRGVIAENFRQLRGSLWKRMHGAGHKSIVVMSGMPSSGATTVAVNLAYAFAAAELRVLLVDANLRRPAVHKVLGMPESPGLADVLAGETALSEAIQQGDTPKLGVLTAGTGDRRVYERLSSSLMSDLLADAAKTYDVVIVDVAPAMVAGDAVAIAGRCDASLLVVRALGEKRGMVARLRNELTDSRAEFLGVLVNAVRSAAGGYLKGNIQATHTYQNGRSTES